MNDLDDFTRRGINAIVGELSDHGVDPYTFFIVTFLGPPRLFELEEQISAVRFMPDGEKRTAPGNIVFARRQVIADIYMDKNK
jgi:hypothetical protein